MINVEALPLFRDLQLAPIKYNNLKIRDERDEIENNRKLKSRLNHYQANINEINQKCNFVAYKTQEDIKDFNDEYLNKFILDLNGYSHKVYSLLKEEDIKCTTTKAVLFSTLDELILINESIKNKDYILNKDSHICLYKNVASNAFATFLALKDMDLNENMMNSLSKAIFNQIKVISVI